MKAFGRLQSLDTGPDGLGDLVVVLGPNEGGKTTLFHFLATALYGFHPAARDAHPYAPWNGSELDGSAVLTMADGTRCEVHRRMGSGTSGTLEHAGISEDLRNRAIPGAEHVPLAVFRQCYALTLAELGALAGESWSRIQDRLIAGLGATDLRTARAVVEELDVEAGGLWRSHRRGNQTVRQLRERLRELDAQRRDVAQADRSLREMVRERERVLAELEDARSEREADEVYVERFRALVPIRAALARVRALELEAGTHAELADLPPDPRGRLAELETMAREQAGRLDEVIRDLESPRQRAAAVREGDAALIASRQEVERVTARIQAAGWMRARASQLDQELRELEGRAESEAAELFDAPIGRVDPERVRALPTGDLKSRARELEEARARLAANREAERQFAESAGREAPSGGGAHWSGALAAAVGAVVLVAGLVLDRGPLAVGGALALGAGAVLLFTAMRRGRPAAASPVDAAAVEREAAARRALLEPLVGLPVRAGLLDRAPTQLALGIERLQHLLRDQREREAERATLRRDSDTLADEMGRLAAACRVEVPDDPIAAAHVLAGAAAEAMRRHASAERATEEVARLERARTREQTGLDRVRMTIEGLRARLATLGDGDHEEGARRFRSRTKAASEAARILADLERAHPDLEDIRARIRQAEEVGEDWVVDDEAVARRHVRRPLLAARVETLARKEAALEQDIEHLAGGETLDRVDGEIEVLTEQLRRLERERDRKHVLGRIIREADRRFREQHQPELVRKAGEYLSAITAGRYERLLLSDGDGDLTFKLRDASSRHPVTIDAPLSTGTREQAYLALRLAAVDQLDKDGERLPLFLDETLVNWDPARRDRGLALLACVARERQVFVFTCQPEAAQALAERGARLITLGE